jgi:cytosine/uracil/thiamine/allantoin permease
MIDSSKTPAAAWKRYATIAALAVLIVVAGFVVWTKELHKSSNHSSSPPAVTVPAPAPQAKPKPTPATTIPGGLPISTRNPFGG